MSETLDSSLSGLNDCGCCSGVAPQTPRSIENRPGLDRITYRVGTWQDFRESLLAELSSLSEPALAPLAGLRTRDNTDFSIALLDAWAAVADVLTFYQERIANESYLRTATERFSILELARLIGYELRPGVAAATSLAFIMNDTSGSPVRTTLDSGLKVQSIPGPGETAQTFETVESIEARIEWSALKPQMTETFIPQFGDTHAYLKGTNTNLKPGDAILLVGSEREGNTSSDSWDFRRVTVVTPDFSAGRTRIEWAKPLGTNWPHVVLPAASPNIYALRVRGSFFGYNAPHPLTLSNDTRTNYGLSGSSDWSYAISSQTIDLDTTYPGILAGSWLVLSHPGYQEIYRANSVIEGSEARYTLAGKTTRISVDTNENLNLYSGASYRDTMVFAQSDPLEFAEQPITTPVTGSTIQLSQAPEGLVKGRHLAASGTDSVTGDEINELVTIADLNGSLLTVTPPLANGYARDSFSLNGNVAAATHGETQPQEVLGSGDATQAFQTFIIRQSPLTFVRSEMFPGSESTLQLRVNGLLWHEQPSLYGHGPQDRIFIARRNDDGKTNIEFGDGVAGARLPTGIDNVRALYRKGLGLAGNVAAGQLTMLLTRPLGLKSVTNPLPAEGGDDPEPLERARANAPLQVLTLGRVVSLEDYEDFARAYPGIAKALATWTWDGHSKGIFLTLAGPQGAAITGTGDVAVKLSSALASAGEPFVRVKLGSYHKATFKLSGSIVVDPDYDSRQVLSQVKKTLASEFGFEAREFGQLVHLSEVIAVMHEVPGIIAVEIQKLYRTNAATQWNDRLLADLPLAGAASVEPAELLILDDNGADDLEVQA